MNNECIKRYEVFMSSHTREGKIERHLSIHEFTYKRGEDRETFIYSWVHIQERGR